VKKGKKELGVAGRQITGGGPPARIETEKKKMKKRLTKSQEKADGQNLGKEAKSASFPCDKTSLL